MDIKIGVQHTARELVIDVDLSADEVQSQVEAALPGGVLSFHDVKGRRVVIPAANLAYVEVSSSTAGFVGFRS